MSKSAIFTVHKTELCPDCGAELAIRSGKHGAFLGCTNYPACAYLRPLKNQSDGHIVKVLEGHACPQCDTDKVLRQGRYGMFISCGHYPDCDYSEAIDKPDETLIPCPQCQEGKLVQRRSRYGKTFHACNRYPTCQFAINGVPAHGECPHCHYPLLVEKKNAQGITLLCASKSCGKTATSGD